jgi:polysaccharide chain length determinant protein (PEP-CTERM system associated)
MKQESATKQLNWREYRDIAIRRRWALLGPFFAIGLAGFILAHVWPARFRSEAMILVDEQKVPDKYVMPNVVTSPETQLQSMTQEILSRTRLEEIIDKFGLYPNERAHQTPDQLVDQMRQNIEITPGASKEHPDQLTEFRISYAAPTPTTAQQVVNDLTSLFIKENIQNRTQESVSTTNFFESQLDLARKDLSDQEHRLAEYKSHYLGELPQQEQSNLQILGELQAQLNGASSALDRAQQEKAYLESTKAEFQDLESSRDSRVINADVSVDPDSQLATLRAKLAELESEYTPRYPDVVSTKQQIAQLEAAKKKKEAVQPATSKDAPKDQDDGHSLVLNSRDPSRMIDVESRLKSTEIEIADRQKDVHTIQSHIAKMESHLNATPIREEELASVTRDTENARQNYQSILDKKTQSALATNMEEHQEGEQFRVVDPPSLPQKPTEPNRAEIILGGWLLGLVVSGGLVALGESANTRLRNESELRTSTQVPILALIPTVQSLKEERMRTFYRRMEVVSVMVLIVLSAGTILFTYMVG